MGYFLVVVSHTEHYFPLLEDHTLSFSLFKREVSNTIVKTLWSKTPLMAFTLSSKTQ